MGLFNRKNEVYARNTKIAELETHIEEIKKKNQKLSIQNAELRAEVANLKSTNNALINDNSILEGKIISMQQEIESLKKNNFGENLKSDYDDKKKAVELKNTASVEYALELKRLKFFCDKFKQDFLSADTAKRQEIADILTNIINESDGVEKDREIKKAVDKLYSSFGVEENANIENSQEFEFDLDAVINPKEELSLEQLCKELGVYRG